MFTLKISKFATYLSSGKERFTLEGGQNPFERRTKEDMDKFEIIRS
jgi:hypothetical protein